MIFGSSFPGDRSVAAIYREIAHIKQAVEVGGCSMLVHAEDVYESLYDMLNQFYTQALGLDLPCSCCVRHRMLEGNSTAV